MGHYIFGIIGPADLLIEFAAANKLHAPAPLQKNGLAFLPLSADHLDFLFPELGGHDDSMPYLSSALKQALIGLSRNGAVAYITTTYLGGAGDQSATVYRDGRCDMEPSTDFRGPISDALQRLGVTKGPGDPDEFAAAGLARYRDNEAWIAAGAAPHGVSEAQADRPPGRIAGIPLIEGSPEPQREQEVQPQPPQRFSGGACIAGAVINLLGCFLLAGMRFMDGMAAFNTTGSSQFTFATLLHWIWSPVAMAAFTLTGAPPAPASVEFAMVSAVSFGVVSGFLIAWIRRPVYA